MDLLQQFQAAKERRSFEHLCITVQVGSPTKERGLDLEIDGVYVANALEVLLGWILSFLVVLGFVSCWIFWATWPFSPVVIPLSKKPHSSKRA